MLSYPTEISKDGDFFLVSLRYFYAKNGEALIEILELAKSK